MYPQENWKETTPSDDTGRFQDHQYELVEET
jgi:hypothetical protein